MHPYERDPQSGAGNCHCGASEYSRRHPHPYRQMDGSEQCVCSALASTAVLHTDTATATASPVRSGLDAVQAAVRAARGGDAPPQIQGYA